MVATRADVARLAGVSSSTVSYVISGQRTISAATKERVEQAMRELDYTPNVFAQGLAGARGGIVALHYPYSTRGVTSSEFEYVSAVAERARVRGYSLLLWSHPIDDLEGLKSLVSQRLVDGVILMELTADDQRVQVMKRTRVPFVTIGRPDDSEGLVFTDNDYESMGRQAIDHLADLGHTSIAFLSQTSGPLDRGYGPLLRVAKSLELPVRRRGVHLVTVPAHDSVQGGRDAFARFAALEPRPTGVVAFNEMATAGFVHAATVAGTAIPADVSLVALSMGHIAAETMSPPLTTVTPSSEQIATTAVDDLADLIEGRSSDAPQVLIAPTLTVRESSASA
ncbi:LacI family DNA-binding transcriptional regulator [Rathayibacter sp. Leaf296]|uniref:LacI family DNA-binding transcriptional regulator n=1 Tax=Rathayibacter sp. Leaf296 TaxID=1736327 RepID=UPI0007027093|nr:LacI family DNA-binding transcriptional regulator [Rathayibacter sp. Leaf296]KQQ09618.1 hypothetical protein ASF46_00280 [Rathayibacter sp. Leaf296]